MTIPKADLLKWLSLAEAAYTPEVPSGFELLSRIKADPNSGHALVDPARLDWGFIAREIATGDIHVWFRGTEDFDEWLDDGFAVPNTQWGGPGYVHAGFFGLWLAIRDSIVLPPRAVLVTGGHSLGAPLATYFALRFGATKLVTFEGPRAGDYAFADHVQSKTPIHVRVVNYCDVVTHMPPRPLWSHAGGYIGFNRFSLDMRTEHSLGLSVAPAIVSMTEPIETSPNLR